MPLSEREQRLLDQMEQALYEEDPKFASVLRKAGPRSFDARQLAVGILVFAAGLVGLIAGVATSIVVLGVVGFLAMLSGVLLAIHAVRKSAATGSSPVSPGDPGRTAASRSGGGFMERIEERWRRRRDSEHG